MKHWPLVLGLVVLLVAAILYVRREPSGPAPAPPPPAAGSTSDLPSPAVGATPTTSPQDPTSPKPVKPPDLGSLRCLLVPDSGPVRGTLLILGADDRKQLAQKASGEGRVEVTLEKLTAGPKRVVFIPERTHAAASAEAMVPPSAVGEVTIELKSAGSLKGKVVDSLQRPLPGATVEITHPALFAPRTPGKAFSVWGTTVGHSSGPGGGSDLVSASRSLMSDGSVVSSITTNRDGEFTLQGIALPSAELAVKYKEVRVTRACTRDGENVLILPVVLEEPVRDLKAEAFQASIQSLLNQMATHHDNPEPYAAQLRDLLRQRLAEAKISPKERELLNKYIDEIGRPGPR